MANVSLTFEDIDNAVTAMNNSRENTLQPAVDAAKTAVDDALANHLIMPSTTPVLIEKYTEFNTQLTELVTNVQTFAKQFTDIKEGMQDMDGKIAENILNPPSQ
ncbi:hypothetical protein [Streptomyces sp. NPDC049881]|uniref:hypothetical protein n=1 Tax=unclassified Streptomyces TaxID=2593676 RepID=UPI0034254B19